MSRQLFAWFFAKKERAFALLSTLKDLQLRRLLECKVGCGLGEDRRAAAPAATGSPTICDIRKRFAIWSLAPGSISSAVAIKHAWLTEVGGNSILNGEEMMSS
jgi:hypothetical protein